ncbi:MAG: FecR family protein [Bacteroidales bacterium]|jgi:ferric-dicitrate binding protein FerR (iron transport regulator)
MKNKKATIDAFTRSLLEKKDTKEVKEMMDKLIPNNKKDRKEFEAYLEVWEKSADVKDFGKVNVDEDWMKVRSGMSFLPRSKQIPLRSFALRIAAILILALGLTFFLLKIVDKTSIPDREYYEIVSAEAIRELSLPDGSVVSLNKQSKLFRNSEFGRSNRDIILEGEAFFNVAKNAELPFRIYSMNSTIEVLGTSFNVKTDTDLIVVSVMTGKVSFYSNEDNEHRLELNPDHSGTLDIKTGKLESHDSFDPNSLAWYTKKFVFRNKPLSEVCRIIADYYELKLMTEEGLEINESITITCSTQSVHEVLSSINLSLKENIRLIATDKNLIVKKL